MIIWTRLPVAMMALAAFAYPSGAGQAAPPRKLEHDPFDRSVVQQLMHQAELPLAAAAPSPDASPASVPPLPEKPAPAAQLRAVMVGGARPLINLGGTILGIGDSIDGFRLVEVRERSAVFTRDGNRVEVALGSGRAP